MGVSKKLTDRLAINLRQIEEIRIEQKRRCQEALTVNVCEAKRSQSSVIRDETSVAILMHAHNDGGGVVLLSSRKRAHIDPGLLKFLDEVGAVIIIADLAEQADLAVHLGKGDRAISCASARRQGQGIHKHRSLLLRLGVVSNRAKQDINKRTA